MELSTQAYSALWGLFLVSYSERGEIYWTAMLLVKVSHFSGFSVFRKTKNKLKFFGIANFNKNNSSR